MLFCAQKGMELKMKIALSSIGSSEKDLLDPRFGRCNYFLIYNSMGELLKAIENKGQFSAGGAGIAAAQQIVDEDIGIVITGSMGPNAFNIMKSSGIKVYQGQEIPCKESIEQFNRGQLSEIGEAGPSHKGMSPC